MNYKPLDTYNFRKGLEEKLVDSTIAIYKFQVHCDLASFKFFTFQNSKNIHSTNIYVPLLSHKTVSLYVEACSNSTVRT